MAVGAVVEPMAKGKSSGDPAHNRQLRDQINRRLVGLKHERNLRDTLYRDLSDQLSPFSGRWDDDQRGHGGTQQIDYSHIYDATGIIAVAQTAAGLMSYGTSPARPWHRNTVSDPKLAQSFEVQAWLDDVTKLQRMVLSKSNVYRVLPMLYEHLIVYGTAAALCLPDPQDVVRLTPLAPGTYWIARDASGRVDTLYRQFSMTAAQILEKWPDTASSVVRNAAKETVDKWFTIVHAIEPRRMRNITSARQESMPWRSVYFEAGTDEGGGILSEGGFRRFPALVPSWQLNASDVYGNSPGMMAVPFCNQLQNMTLMKGKAVQAMADPAKQAPASLKNSPDLDTEPGGISYVDQTNPNGGIRPIWEARIDLVPISQDILDIRNQIRTALFADLFTMLVEAVEGRMTAAEFGMRVQQKMLMLGPVVTSLNTELLAPLLEMIYEALLEGGAIPPTPAAMADTGFDFTPEFMGVLAQAQQASGVAATERVVTFAGALAQMKPDVLDVIDFDAKLRAYADALGVDPDTLVSPDRVQELRAARARAEAAKEQMAMIEQQSVAARNLGSVDMSRPNLVNNPAGPVEQFAGYGAGQV